MFVKFLSVFRTLNYNQKIQKCQKHSPERHLSLEATSKEEALMQMNRVKHFLNFIHSSMMSWCSFYWAGWYRKKFVFRKTRFHRQSKRLGRGQRNWNITWWRKRRWRKRCVQRHRSFGFDSRNAILNWWRSHRIRWLKVVWNNMHISKACSSKSCKLKLKHM